MTTIDLDKLQSVTGGAPGVRTDWAGTWNFWSNVVTGKQKNFGFWGGYPRDNAAGQPAGAQQ